MYLVQILLYLVILHCTQNGDAKVFDYKLASDVGLKQESNKLVTLTQLNYDSRSIKDVWNHVRNSVANAWNFVKILAENTKKKLDAWMSNVKKRATDLTIKFQEHMRHLKENITDIIKKTFGNSKVVKMCLEKEKPEIDKIINEIMKKLSICIADKISHSPETVNLLTVNDTNFYKNLEHRCQLCEHDLDNAEDCLNKVRLDHFNDMRDMETDFLRTRIKTRSILDDLLEALAACSIDGLWAASSAVTLEIVKITKCILQTQQIIN